MHSLKSIATMAAAATFLVVGPVQAYVSKDIRDWSVQCTNGLTCDMSFSDWKAKGVQSITFVRTGAPHAPVSLRLRMSSDFAPGSDTGAAYAVSVDGRPMLSIKAGELAADESGLGGNFSDPAKVLALLEAMKGGTSAEVTVTSAAGSQVLAVKLTGVKGSMLYMDEVQGRLKRVDALDAKGDTQPEETSVAKDLASLDDLPAIVRKDFTDAGAACADVEPESFGDLGGFDVMIGTMRLIGVPCGMGGAYNQPFALYAGYDTIIERISFPVMRDGKPTAMTSAYNIDLDPVKGVLTSFFKGRGLGDCGQYFTWKIDEASSSLEMIEERARGECEGQEGGPDTFPIVFQAKP